MHSNGLGRAPLMLAVRRKYEYRSPETGSCLFNGAARLRRPLVCGHLRMVREQRFEGWMVPDANALDARARRHTASLRRGCGRFAACAPSGSPATDVAGLVRVGGRHCGRNRRRPATAHGRRLHARDGDSMRSPNPPPAANPAVTLVANSWPRWRGVAEASHWGVVA